MHKGFVNRILLTTLYRDLCSATDEHPVALVDLPPDSLSCSKVDSDTPIRSDLNRKLCYFPSSSYVGQSDGFVLFSMPPGTQNEGWRVAVPRNRTQRMRNAPTKALRNGYIVRYPISHYAYPLIRGNEKSIIETDDLQKDLLFGLYLEWLPPDSVAHWVRVGGNHVIHVKRHGLCSDYRRKAITSRVVMRDYWNDQYFGTKTGGGRIFFDDLHASTICRITSISKSKIRDLASDGSSKAMSRFMNEDTEWYQCGCGRLGVAIHGVSYVYANGVRYPKFSVTCPSCGSDCTPPWFDEMNRSIESYAIASSKSGGDPFPEMTPTYNVLRPRRDSIQYP